MTGSTQGFIIPDCCTALSKKEPANEEMTTNKELALMKQFLEVSSVKRASNKTSETSAPFKSLSEFWRDTAIVLYSLSRSRRPKQAVALTTVEIFSLKVSSDVAIVPTSSSIVSALIAIAPFVVHAIHSGKSK